MKKKKEITIRFLKQYKRGQLAYTNKLLLSFYEIVTPKKSDFNHRAKGLHFEYKHSNNKTGE